MSTKQDNGTPPSPTPAPKQKVLEELSEKEIKQAFETLVSRKFTAENQRKLSTHKELDRILKEYMDCCIMLGYDINGNGVVKMIHNNNMQHDALCNLLHKVVMSQFGPMGGPSIE